MERPTESIEKHAPRVVRILSNGHRNGTQVWLSDGSKLGAVRGLEWTVDAETQVAQAKIIVDAVEMDVMASGETYEWHTE